MKVTKLILASKNKNESTIAKVIGSVSKSEREALYTKGVEIIYSYRDSFTDSSFRAFAVNDSGVEVYSDYVNGKLVYSDETVES
jgi:hypothetical protein